MDERLLVRDLAREIADGQVVAVVGAGVSIAASGGAQAASWTGLLATGVEHCEQIIPGLPVRWGERLRGQLDSGDLDDLLSAATNVTRKLGGRQGGEYRRWLRETVGRLEIYDRSVPEMLDRLGIPLVTTNYDDLLEQVTGLDSVIWRDGPQVQRVLRNEARGIVHLHGHWQEPESVVLGIDSYEDVLRDATAQALLRALASFRSFLLVGFGVGLADPNLAALRSWMIEAHGGSEYRHYRLVLDDEVKVVAAEHDPRERIMPVPYGARHQDLAGFLGGLGGKVPHEWATQRVGASRLAVSEVAERRYREVALRAFDIIDLANLPEHDRHIATRDLELRRLYVALHVDVEAPAEVELGESNLLALEQRRSGRILKALGSMPPRGAGRQRVPVGQRLGAARRLVVLGDPGAGKTTLLRWLATAYLLRPQQDEDLTGLADWETLPGQDWLPVLIRCRDLGKEDITRSVGDALRYSLRKLELPPNECEAVLAMLRRRAAEGAALVLIDGLDEITNQTLRARFCRQLEQFHVAYPQTPIVVTSRIVGYRELGTRIGRGFEHLTLSDLTPEEKDEFARRWCTLTELPERRAEAEAGLIRDLHATQRIEDLTGNPMLLTTMALVRRRIGKLPSRRVSLYEEAVKTLLNWRREVDEPLDEDEALPQLRYLAYAMCDRGVQQVRHDEAVGLLRDFREEHPQLRRVARREPEDFLRLLEARTGILAETGEVRHDGELMPVYEFRHLTFQEYLAGLALVCGHFPGAGRYSRLAERVAPLAARLTKPESCTTGVTESWREPLRLCLAACNDADADATLLAILMPAVGEDAVATGRGRAVQAALCLADEPNVTDAVANEVLHTFVRHIDAADGREGPETTLDNAARELATSDWVSPLERLLCAEFQARKPAARTSVGRVHKFTSDALRPTDDAELVEWTRVQVSALTSSDDIRAIDAALHLQRTAETHPGIIRRVPNVGSMLMATLERAGSLSHVVAWTLSRLVYPLDWFYERGWQPTIADLCRLHLLLIGSTTDVGAMCSIMSILGKQRFVAAASALNELLRHPEAVVRREAALALGALGNYRAADPLVALLRESDTTCWKEAARALGRMGDRRGFSVLLERLNDPEVRMRRTTSRILEEALYESDDEGAVGPLLKLLNDTDAAVCSAAISALGRSGDQQAADSLLKLLNNADAQLRSGAAWALRNVGDEQAIDPLLKRLDDTVPHVRWLAAYALGNVGDERTVKPLLERLADSEIGARSTAAQTLGELGDTRAVVPLLELLDDTKAVVRSMTARALGALGDKRSIDPLLKLLDDAGPEVRSAAARTLGELGDEHVVDPLLNLLGDSDPQVRANVAWALGNLGDRRAVEPLLDRLGDPDPGARSAIIGAVCKLGEDQDLKSLLERLLFHDGPVRAATARALRSLGNERLIEPLLARLDEMEIRAAVTEVLRGLIDGRAAELLLQRLDDDDADLRAASATALGSLGDSRAVEPLLARLDDDFLNVRVAAVEGLGRLGDERAVAPLLEFLQSSSGSLREEATRALGRIGDPGGLAQLHHLLRSTVRNVRIAALEGLSYTCDDETDRKLLTRAVNGRQPFLDCRLRIGHLQLHRAARILNLSEKQIQLRYEALSERFALKLAWRDEQGPSSEARR